MTAKLTGDRHLGIDVFADLGLVEYLGNAGLGVPRSGLLVARYAADGRLGGAAGTSAVLACTGTAACAAYAHLVAFRAVAGAVLEVAGGEAGGLEAVLVVVYGRLGAGDGTALEVGGTLYLDVEAAVACADGTLFGDAAECAADVAGPHAEAAARSGADGDGAPGVLAAFLVAAAVLQVLDVQVAAYAGIDGFCRDHAALDGGVAAALQGGADRRRGAFRYQIRSCLRMFHMRQRPD